MIHPHSEPVPLDADGNCAVCHQPIRENKPAKPRKRRSRLIITEPEGSEGAIEEKAMILGERWSEHGWDTMEPGVRGWLGRVIDYALHECVMSGVVPSEEGGMADTSGVLREIREFLARGRGDEVSALLAKVEAVIGP